MVNFADWSTDLTALIFFCVCAFTIVKFTLLFAIPAHVERAKAAGDKQIALLHPAAPYQLIRARHGLLLANANDTYLGKAIVEYGEYCEEEGNFLMGLLSLRPGKVVEVGANIGTHTLPLAKALGLEKRALVAFEPQAFIFQNLCANLALNAIHNVIAIPAACGSVPGSVYFTEPNYTEVGNFGGVTMESKVKPGRIAVPCVRLDDTLGDDAVSLLKIDVEGYELQVLQGASELLDRWRPIIYVENDRSSLSQPLIEWLWSKNYRLFWHTPSLYNKDNYFRNHENIYGQLVSSNMVCFPRESPTQIDGVLEITDSSYHPFPT